MAPGALGLSVHAESKPIKATELVIRSLHRTGLCARSERNPTARERRPTKCEPGVRAESNPHLSGEMIDTPLVATRCGWYGCLITPADLKSEPRRATAMPVIRPDVQAFLDRVKAAAGPSVSQLGPEGSRQMYKAMMAAVEP